MGVSNDRSVVPLGDTVADNGEKSSKLSPSLVKKSTIGDDGNLISMSGEICSFQSSESVWQDFLALPFKISSVR